MLLGAMVFPVQEGDSERVVKYLSCARAAVPFQINPQLVVISLVSFLFLSYSLTKTPTPFERSLGGTSTDLILRFRSMFKNVSSCLKIKVMQLSSHKIQMKQIYDILPHCPWMH